MPSNKDLYSIGEFSIITKLTIKAIRFYHEKGLLPPAYIEESTGYRFYGREEIEKARIISLLRGFELPLTDTKAILEDTLNNAKIAEILGKHRQLLHQRIKEQKRIAGQLEEVDREVDTGVGWHGLGRGLTNGGERLKRQESASTDKRQDGYGADHQHPRTASLENG